MRWRNVIVLTFLAITPFILRGCQPSPPSPPIQPQVTYLYYFPFVPVSYNLKRGVVNLSNCANVKTVGVAWTYGYSPIASDCPNAENVPMIRDASQVEWLRKGGKVSGNSDYILGFNEPDGGCVYGSCLSPQDAVPLWHEIEEWYPNKLLVAPSPSSAYKFDQTNWLARFRDEYHSRYGEFPRMDALAVHIYYDTADPAIQVVREAIQVADEWNIADIWVTEFGQPYITCGSTLDLNEEKRFLHYLDNEPRVSRYSWFGTNIQIPSDWFPLFWCDLSLVDASGQLTEYGKAYVEQ